MPIVLAVLQGTTSACVVLIAHTVLSLGAAVTACLYYSKQERSMHSFVSILDGTQVRELRGNCERQVFSRSSVHPPAALTIAVTLKGNGR